jgi:hypothetical protein
MVPIVRRAGIILIIIFLCSFGTTPVYGENRATIYFFFGEGCPHCTKEKEFLATLKQQYPQIGIKGYEVWYNPANARLFVFVASLYGTKAKGVPMTFIGSFEPIAGYRTEGTTGKIIRERVKYCIDHGCEDPIASALSVLEPTMPSKSEKPAAGESTPIPEQKPVTRAPEKKESYLPKPPEAQLPSTEAKPEEAAKEPPREPMDTVISIPLIGDTDVSGMTLPVLTVILAGLDSFNPCAFFVLFTLLGILVHAQSRKRMFLIGGTFVFFSGFIYFLFMSAWLNIFMHIGELMIITFIAGIIALIIAAVNIKDFFFFKRGVSLSIPESAKPKLFDRMRKLVKATSLPSMILGTVVLSVAANTYELLCTVGFPLVFTRVLTLNKLSVAQYYFYLVLYNVVYVIPLAIIVTMFSITLGARKLSEWHGQVLKLISGLMMLFLGLILVLNPTLFNNILVGIGLLVLSLLTAWAIIGITRMLEKAKA